MRHRLAVLAPAILAPSALAGQTAAPGPGTAAELDSLFAGVEEATAVVTDGATGRTLRYRPERAGERFVPASTFKVANTVIALETGVASGPEFALPWDSLRVPRTGFFPEAWARDQTLRSAFRHSVYWFYQEVARRIGPARMRSWLQRFDYGNRSMDGGIDRFWLEGGLRISPEEQVRFLRRLVDGELGVGPGTLAALRDIALLQEGDGWRLYGKTGTSEVTATRENGWIVGWAEGPAGASFFTINMEGEGVWEEWPPQRRHVLAVRVLRATGMLPGDEEGDPGSPAVSPRRASPPPTGSGSPP